MNFSINFFDILLVSILTAGIFYGRKHGLSIELFGVTKWLALLLGCALFYRPAGAITAQMAGLSLLTSYLISYIGTALLIFALFSVIQRRFAPKLVGTDAFGRGEYYLGAISGLVQFGCMILMVLALLNAREFTPAELRALEQYQEAAYGSSVFPNLHSFQASVFERSLFGPWVREELSFLLIEPTQADQVQPGLREPKAPAATARK